MTSQSGVLTISIGAPAGPGATGTGKTAAYGLPLLQLAHRDKKDADTSTVVDDAVDRFVDLLLVAALAAVDVGHPLAHDLEAGDGSAL